MQSSSPLPPVLPSRLSSLDAYRGFVMFLMMAEVLRIRQVAGHFPGNKVWELLAFNTSHVEWSGCSLHDLIQPSFSFLVGVARPFSIASRKAKGQSFRRMLFHAAWRALLLVALGVFLRSTHSSQTRFTFEDTLSQIGLGYIFLFLLGFTCVWWQALALAVILVGYWGAFAWYPLPPADFDYSSVSVSEKWIAENPPYTGFAAHWNKNTNLAWTFDQWFLRHFPYEEPFKPNLGGYCTLSFIPTLGTMILGLIAGGWLKSGKPKSKKVLWLVAAGGVALAAGFLLDKYGICPSVKRIWTPAWVLYSGGWCLLMLAGFYGVIDGLAWRAWSFPLIVIGMNSIAIYCLVHLIQGFILQSFQIHFGQDWFKFLEKLWFKISGNTPEVLVDIEPLVLGGAVLIVYWLILYWMYRNKIFVRI
ncbi:MAG: acyltransferase family protein [Deltaproteobacteria bacterium]